MSSPAQSSRRIAPVFTAPPALNLRNVSRNFNVRIYNKEQSEYAEHPALTSISLQKGSLAVNGAQVAQPSFGRNFVRFTGDHEQGFSSGVLNFTHDAHAFTGKVFMGSSASTAVAHDIVGVTPDTVYRTRVCKQGVAPGSSPFPLWSPPEPAAQDQWEDGLELILGYRFSETGNLPTPVFRINDLSGKNDPVDIPCVPSVDQKSQNLILTLLSDPGTASLGVDQYGPLFPNAFVIELSWDGSSFRGALQRYDPATAQGSKLQYAWHGTANAPQPVQAAHTAAVARVSAVRAAAPTPVRLGSPQLTIAELFTLQPDPQTLQNDQFSLLTENMKWALGNNSPTQDWDSNFFGQVAPQGLSQDRINLITKDKSFYTDHFAVAFLGYSFNRMNGPGAPDTKLSADQALDLSFYMRAGLAADPAYGRQSKGIFMEAFLQSLPRLGDYLSDQTANTANGIADTDHNWAQKFFNQLTTSTMMVITVEKILGGQSMDELHRQCTLLQALQPSGDLAAQYYQLVLAALLSQAVDHLKLDDPKAVQAWLGDAIQGFILALEQDRLNVPGLDVATQAELRAAAVELQQAVKVAGGISNVAASIANVISSLSGTGLWERLNIAQGRLAQAGVKFAKLLHTLAVAGGLANAILAFQNWREQSELARANTLVSTVEVSAAVFKFGTKWTIKTVRAFQAWRADPEVMQPLLREAVPNYGSIEMTVRGIRDSIPEPEADAEPELPPVERSAWGTAFEESVAKVVRGLSVATSFAFLIISALQLDKDINDDNADSYTKTMDSLILASNITVFVCTAADILLVDVAAAVPVIGAVAAVIGFVLTLVGLFKHPDPPPSPAELFMRNNLLPAFSGPNRWILDAPAGWNIDQDVPQNNAYNPH